MPQSTIESQISYAEAIKFGLSRLRDAGLGLLPDETKLGILIQQAQGTVDDTKRLYHEALKAEAELLDPSNPEDGKLAAARAKLARREEQGAKWGREYNTLNSAADKPRKDRLFDQMQQCTREIDTLEKQIPDMERDLEMRRETTTLRRKQWEDAKEELRLLKDVAPTLLAQAQALDETTRAKMAAVADAKSSAGKTPASGAIINQYTAKLAKARAGFSAASVIERETTTDNIDLDAVDEAESHDLSANERIARWTSK